MDGVESAIVERMQRGYAAFNRGDVEAAFGDVGDDFELVLPFELPDGRRVFRGREGLREWWSTALEIFNGWTAVPEEVMVLDEGRRVLVWVREALRGAGSDVPLENANAHLWTLAPDGRFTGLRVFMDRREAARAAGLPDQP